MLNNDITGEPLNQKKLCEQNKPWLVAVAQERGVFARNTGKLALLNHSALKKSNHLMKQLKQNLEERNVEERRVKIDKLEHENLECKVGLVFACGAVVFPVVELHGQRLVHNVENHNHNQVDNRARERRNGGRCRINEWLMKF